MTDKLTAEQTKVLRDLRKLREPLRKAQTTAQKLQDDRDALFIRGKEIGVPVVQMAAEVDVTDRAIFSVLRKHNIAETPARKASAAKGRAVKKAPVLAIGSGKRVR